MTPDETTNGTIEEEDESAVSSSPPVNGRPQGQRRSHKKGLLAFGALALCLATLEGAWVNFDALTATYRRLAQGPLDIHWSGWRRMNDRKEWVVSRMNP
jgi:hypothetical protein